MRVDYISREDALTIFAERNPDLVSIISDSGDNPLPNTVRISNIPLASYDAINQFLAEYKDVLQYDEGTLDKQLIAFRTQYNQAQSVVTALQSLNIAVYVLIGLFLLTVFVVVHMIIRNFIFFLQDEIRIIELVGGKGSFIYGPFIIQGSIYMLIAVAIVFLVFYIFEVLGGVPMIPEIFRGTYINFRELFLSVYI